MAPPGNHGRYLRVDAGTGTAEFVPLAMLFADNPYRAVNPPNPDGGFHSQEEVHV